MAAAESIIPPAPDAAPLALFDMDGTLTDPADGIISCHRWALDQIGFELPSDVDTSSMIGPPAEEAYEMIGVPADRIAEATQLYRERFAIAGWLEDAPYPGIPELIAELHDSGWVIGVATMKLEPFAERIIDRIGLRPRVSVVSGSDAARTRLTKRAVIEHALSKLDREPAGVAMIGDRRHDVEAARALRMTSIGAGWGFGSVEELMAADAHAIAMTPADVAEILLG